MVFNLAQSKNEVDYFTLLSFTCRKNTLKIVIFTNPLQKSLLVCCSNTLSKLKWLPENLVLELTASKKGYPGFQSLNGASSAWTGF